MCAAGQRHGFIMDADQIKQAITSDGQEEYHPDPVDPATIELVRGTTLILTGTKRQLHRSSAALRRRLARRFSIIGAPSPFRDHISTGSPISIDDRGYHLDKLQYVWTFGTRGAEVVPLAKRTLDARLCAAVRTSHLTVVHSQSKVGLGRPMSPRQLKDADSRESLNRIVIMVRGKLAQEDILEEFGEAGIYSTYLIGEIHADFLDDDHEQDIATSSRQHIVEYDPRYQALKDKLQAELKVIEGKWGSLRNESGGKVATTIPQIKEWFTGLNPDHRESAKRLFGKINQLRIDDPGQKRQVFISGILAFESLRFRNLLHRIEGISAQNIGALGDVFTQLDDLEASAYYQISKDRLDVITSLTGLLDADVKEKVLQQHLFKHLWLLDPSWERAAHTARMESRVATALDAVSAKLTKQQRRARTDIRYSTTGNRHVIIELKRSSVVTNTGDLVGQVRKYYDLARSPRCCVKQGRAMSLWRSFAWSASLSQIGRIQMGWIRRQRHSPRHMPGS